MTSSSDPDVIRQQIEDTRADLSYNVDALNEKVNPARVVDRRVTRTKDAAASLRHRVMGQDSSTGGAASTVSDAASSAGDSVRNAAQGAAGAVSSTPDAVVSRTQGSPLAAGLVAFGVGWLGSSLLPTTEKEKQLASQAGSAAKEHGQPLVEQAKQAAQDVGEALKPAAQDAVESIKGTAQEATETVKQEGQSAASDVQGRPSSPGRTCSNSAS